MEKYEEKNACVQQELLNRSLPLEWNAELSLPDYRSEISRLLWIRPTVLPPTRFFSGDSVELSGRVNYDALYAGPDGRLYSVTAEEPYAFSVPLGEADPETLSVELVPDVVVGRVAAPRKLTVRCRVHAQVRGYGTKCLAADMPKETEGKVCRLGRMIEGGKLVVGSGEAVELCEDIFVEDTGELRVIAARGEAFLPEVSAGEGSVHCRGEVVLTLLLERAEGEDTPSPFVAVRRLPFEAEVPLTDMVPDSKARAFAAVEEIRTTVETGKITAAVRLLPTAEAQGKELAYYTADLFLPGADTVCKYEQQQLWLPTLCCNRNYSISGVIRPGDIGMPSDAELLDVTADAELRERIPDERGTTLSGQLCCHILYRRGAEYGAAEGSVPFRVILEGKHEGLSAVCRVPICRARCERESLTVDAELAVMARGYAPQTVTVLSEAGFSPSTAAPRADIELCYPRGEDTLWQIAKRYAVDPADLAAANGIAREPDAALEGVRYLMIPRGNSAS